MRVQDIFFVCHHANEMPLIFQISIPLCKEYLEKDQNYLYEMAQWFPRMAVYDDVNGWQHKQYIGRGEFALPFGD